MKKEIVNEIEVIDATTSTPKKTRGCDAFTIICTGVQDADKLVVKESDNGVIYTNAPKDSYTVKKFPGDVVAIGYIGNRNFAYALGDSAVYTGAQIIVRSGIAHQPFDQTVANEEKQPVQNAKRTTAKINRAVIQYP